MILENESLSDKVTGLLHYLLSFDFWINIGQGLLEIIAILVIAAILIKIGSKVADKVFSNKRGGPLRISVRREETLKRLVHNILKYTIYFIAFIMILGDVLGLKIGPLIASAGVVGLAIGFGAQSLVKDIISGFFIIFEDQFAVGDYISASGAEGTVEEIGIRSTKVMAWTGEEHIIQNGNITQVTNYSVHNGLAVVDINVPYESDIIKAERIIEDVIEGLVDKYEEIVDVPRIHGVQSLEQSHFVIRVVAETMPVYQWAGARIIRKEVKERLYREGIEIPAPRLVMYSRSETPVSPEPTRNSRERLQE